MLFRWLVETIEASKVPRLLNKPLTPFVCPFVALNDHSWFQFQISIQTLRYKIADLGEIMLWVNCKILIHYMDNRCVITRKV